MYAEGWQRRVDEWAERARAHEADGCPPWCRVQQHHSGERGGIPIVHAASAGNLEVTSTSGGDPTRAMNVGFVRGLESGYFGASGLRQLAADAVRLADWVEAQS
jgi:hypothetical protein